MDNRSDRGRHQRPQGEGRFSQQTGPSMPRADAVRSGRAAPRPPQMNPHSAASQPRQSQLGAPHQRYRSQNGGSFQPAAGVGARPQMRGQRSGRQINDAMIPAGGVGHGFAPAASASQYSRANYGSAMQQKKKGGPWKVVLVGSLIVFVAALLALGVILFSYWQGRSVYDDVAETGFHAPNDVSGAQLADLQVDWDALRAINPDVVAWVYIPDTNINYPIVHGSDNEYYLTHDFQGSEGWLATFGTIFLEASNAADFSDQNNVMYGHNMNDGSMFSDIASFGDAQVFNDHRTVFVLTPQGNYRLTTFSLVHCAATDPLVKTVFGSSDDYRDYLQDKIDRSVVPASDVVAAADMTKTFAFSTCDNLPSDGRYVLFGYVAETTVSGVQVPDDSGDADGAVEESEAAVIASGVEGAVAA